MSDQPKPTTGDAVWAKEHHLAYLNWEKQLAAARSMSHCLGKLLAVIHCDGGHYQSEHGTEKATKAAIEKRTAMVMRIDELETQLAAEREAAKKLCELYFNIAAEAIGEDEVRRKRDAALAKVKEGK